MLTCGIYRGSLVEARGHTAYSVWLHRDAAAGYIFSTQGDLAAGQPADRAICGGGIYDRYLLLTLASMRDKSIRTL